MPHNPVAIFEDFNVKPMPDNPAAISLKISMSNPFHVEVDVDVFYLTEWSLLILKCLCKYTEPDPG